MAEDDYDVGRGHAMALFGVLKNGATISDKHVNSGTSHSYAFTELRLDGIDRRCIGVVIQYPCGGRSRPLGGLSLGHGVEHSMDHGRAVVLVAVVIVLLAIFHTGGDGGEGTGGEVY